MSLIDDLAVGAGWSRAPAAPACVCGAMVVTARSVHGGEVVLDAGEPGTPARVRGGDWTQIATQADVFHRQPLVVDEVGRGNGEHRRHRCEGAS